MNWIKQHPVQLSLAAISCGVITATAALYLSTVAFPRTFQAHRIVTIPEDAVPAVNAAPLNQAISAAATPAIWESRDPESDRRLFAAKAYIREGDRLVQPKDTALFGDVSYSWLKAHGLNTMDPKGLADDPDRDGFTTLQEWDGMDAVSHIAGKVPVLDRTGSPLSADSTNPVDPTSHPPYHTLLALNRIETIPFRLKFMTANVDTKNPKNTRMQINMVDLRMPTQYVPIGEDIAGTHFKVLSYDEKSVPGLDGTSKDVSELTILNKKSGEELVLPKGVVVNSPEGYAVIDYFWSPSGGSSAKPSAVFQRRKGEMFSIAPKSEDTYRVSAIREDAVDITLPSGEIWTLQKSPR